MLSLLSSDEGGEDDEEDDDTKSTYGLSVRKASFSDFQPVVDAFMGLKIDGFLCMSLVKETDCKEILAVLFIKINNLHLVAVKDKDTHSTVISWSVFNIYLVAGKEEDFPSLLMFFSMRVYKLSCPETENNKDKALSSEFGHERKFQIVGTDCGLLATKGSPDCFGMFIQGADFFYCERTVPGSSKLTHMRKVCSSTNKVSPCDMIFVDLRLEDVHVDERCFHVHDFLDIDFLGFFLVEDVHKNDPFLSRIILVIMVICYDCRSFDYVSSLHRHIGELTVKLNYKDKKIRWEICSLEESSMVHHLEGNVSLVLSNGKLHLLVHSKMKREGANLFACSKFLEWFLRALGFHSQRKTSVWRPSDVKDVGRKGMKISWAKPAHAGEQQNAILKVDVGDLMHGPTVHACMMDGLMVHSAKSDVMADDTLLLSQGSSNLQLYMTRVRRVAGDRTVCFFWGINQCNVCPPDINELLFNRQGQPASLYCHCSDFRDKGNLSFLDAPDGPQGL